MKTNLKVLVVFAIILGAILVFVPNKVEANQYATIMSGTVTEQALNNISDTIKVDLKESEFEKVPEIIMGQVTAELTKQGIVVGNTYDNSIGNIYVGFQEEKTYTPISDVAWTRTNCNIHKVIVSINVRNSDIMVNKMFTIEYSNTKNYTEANKNYVSNLVKNINNTTIDAYYGANVSDGWTCASQIIDTLNKKINDATIKFIENGGTGDFDKQILDYAVFKDDVYYQSITITSNVSEMIEDKDKNYNEADKNYVENLIKKFQDTTPPYWINMDLYLYDGQSIDEAITKKFNDASITLIPDGRAAGDIDWFEKGFWVCKNNVKYQQIQVRGDIYRVRKDVKIDNNISISGLLPDVNVKGERKENNEMVTEVNNAGYTKVLGTYELTLTGATSLANPIDITFDLGTEYNGQVAYILHKKANGSYERFEEQIKDGKVTITVSELSPFVVAVKEKTENENNQKPTTNKGEKDTTPKTGTIDIIGYVLVTTILSGAGIVALKKKI